MPRMNNETKLLFAIEHILHLEDLIEGKLPSKGSRVTVLEDVVTTGGSSIKAVEKLRDAGYVVERVVSIVNRQEGTEADDAFAAVGVELISLFSLEEFAE